MRGGTTYMLARSNYANASAATPGAPLFRLGWKPTIGFRVRVIGVPTGALSGAAGDCNNELLFYLTVDLLGGKELP